MTRSRSTKSCSRKWYDTILVREGGWNYGRAEYRLHAQYGKEHHFHENREISVFAPSISSTETKASTKRSKKPALLSRKPTLRFGETDRCIAPRLCLEICDEIYSPTSTEHAQHPSPSNPSIDAGDESRPDDHPRRVSRRISAPHIPRDGSRHPRSRHSDVSRGILGWHRGIVNTRNQQDMFFYLWGKTV